MTSSNCFSESLPTPRILLLCPRNSWAPHDVVHSLEGELDRTVNALQGFILGSSYKPCRSAGVGQDYPCTDLQTGKGKPRGYNGQHRVPCEWGWDDSWMPGLLTAILMLFLPPTWSWFAQEPLRKGWSAFDSPETFLIASSAVKLDLYASQWLRLWSIYKWQFSWSSWIWKTYVWYREVFNCTVLTTGFIYNN